MKEQAADAVVAGVAHKVATAGGGVALYGGLTANEIAAFGGLAIAFVGLLVQVFFKVRADRRAVELHRARLAELAEGDEA